jgi:TonB family protein
LEIFSGQARAFGEREVRTLQMLSRSIVENIELARRASANAEAGRAIEVADGKGKIEAEPNLVKADPVETGPVEGGEAQETADFWTGALMVAVVVLALTLGWMVGRGSRQATRANSLRQSDAASLNKGDTGRANAAANPAAKPATTTEVSGGGSVGELVIFQDGKKVFPTTPSARDAQQPDSPPAAAVRPAVETSKVQAVAPVRIPPEVSVGVVTQRVEPEYPQSARERRVQGAVVLDATVGRDGVVEKFTAIRGDPDLAAAASAAVRQWRFKPLVRNGQSEDFQTRVTVEFRLP